MSIKKQASYTFHGPIKTNDDDDDDDVDGDDKGNKPLFS